MDSIIMWKAIKAHAEVFFSLCKVYIILITISTFLKFFVLLNTIAKNTEKKPEKKKKREINIRNVYRDYSRWAERANC